MATASPHKHNKYLLKATPLSVIPQVFSPPPVPAATSLVSCAWCTKEISDKAESCPHCGRLRKYIREQEEQRICEWCNTSISQYAACCPCCGKWQKDIMKLRFRMRKQLISMIVCAIIIAVMFIYSRPRGGILWDNRRWHEIVTFPGSARLGWNEQPKGGFPNDFFPRSELRFSMQKFSKSESGWIIIASFIWFFVSAFSRIYNQSVLRRKRGNY